MGRMTSIGPASKIPPGTVTQVDKWAVGNNGEPFQISVEDRQREIAERHERSRRLLDEVFDEVCGDKAGALHARD